MSRKKAGSFTKKGRITLYKFSKIFSFFSILLILVVLPATIVLTQKQTNLEQHAATTTPSVYYGSYVPNGFQIGTNLATFEADAGKPMAIIPWYLNFTTSFPTNTMTAIRQHGSIPELTWQPDGGGISPAYSLKNITAGNFDAYITKFAQAAKVWGHPFFLRFAHEMNGGYGWTEHTNGNSVGEYVPMWRHVHDIFTSVGATNVTWVWCPNQGSSIATYAELYPGDNYVDWTCLDGYNWGAPNPQQTWARWQSFSTIFKGNYNSLVQIAPTKPMMIGETASVENGGNKAAWITDALMVQLPINFPQIKAFLWFNESNTQWRIETSPAARQAFAAGIASSYYASNQFGNIATSPIPPLSLLTMLPGASTMPTPTITNSSGISISPLPTTPPAGSITGTVIARDTFNRANQSRWGQASDGQTWGGDANTKESFSIVDNTGQIGRGYSNYNYNALIGPSVTNAEITFSGTMNNFAYGNIGGILRWSDANNFYKAYINGTKFILEKRVQGKKTELFSSPFKATAGISYTVRFRIVGTQLSAKVWQTNTAEPTGWIATISDSSLTSGYCGLRTLFQTREIATYTSFTAIHL